MPTWGSSAAGNAIIVSADRATIGTAHATTGSTVFAGDRLNTDQSGHLQIRAGAARLLLTSSSHAIWSQEEGAAEATLTSGNAVFSTANAKAFQLRASTAVFRPQGDQPTIGNVTLLNAKELVVRCSRGALTIAVEDDVRVIPEGTAYRIVLDANSLSSADTPQWDPRPPKKPGKSKFIWYAIAFTTGITAIGVYEALESPDRP